MFSWLSLSLLFGWSFLCSEYSVPSALSSAAAFSRQPSPVLSHFWRFVATWLRMSSFICFSFLCVLLWPLDFLSQTSLAQLCLLKK